MRPSSFSFSCQRCNSSLSLRIFTSSHWLRRHVAQKLIRFRYVESKLYQVFVTRSGASSMKPKVFASNTTPTSDRGSFLCFLVSVIGIGSSLCGGGRAGAKPFAKQPNWCANISINLYSIASSLGCHVWKHTKNLHNLFESPRQKKKWEKMKKIMREHVTSSQFDFCGARKCFLCRGNVKNSTNKFVCFVFYKFAAS